METLVANLTGKVRRETLGGREYLVAPATLLVPGVLNGSQGLLLYTLEDIQRDPDRWNGLPIVAGHPYEGGLPISARRPDVLDNQGIGHVFNAQVNGKLSADLWFDVERTRKVDERIISDLEGNRPIELSTGLFISNEPSKGTHNGKQYEGIARDHSPDHLAILLDYEGACSVSDGCGVLVNEDGKALVRRLAEFLGLMGNGKKLLANLKGGESILMPSLPPINELRSGFTWERVLKDNSINDFEYRITKMTAQELRESKEKRSMAEKTESERKALVDGLIANCDCWDESDREDLNTLHDDKLTALNKHSEKEKQTELVANATRKGFEDQQGNSHAFNEKTGKWDTKSKKQETKPKIDTNETKDKPQTTEEWMKSAPGEVQSAVRNAMDIETKEKSQIIEQMTTNVDDGSKELVVKRLQAKPLDELRDLSALVPIKPIDPCTSSYFGAALPASNQLAQDDKDDILPLPTCNWGREDEQKRA